MRGILTVCAAFAAVGALAVAPSPREVFENPPKEAHAGVWWHWMGGQVTKEGIEKDLDWFERMGISSATILGLADATVPWAKRIANIPTGGLHPYDDEWWRLVKFACAEGKKRGIDIGLHNCPGYTSTGGKWVPPRLAMRRLVFNVEDPAKDIALAAEAPSPVYDEEKGIFGKPDCPARLSDCQPIAVVRGVKVAHIPTGSYVQPADWDSRGLECDKMNPEAVRFHLDHVIGEMKKHLGDDLPAAGLQHILLDSYEAGRSDWTPAMREEFLARRGYDCLDFLPILGGFTNLYTAAECEKFKRDYDRTIKDLYRDVLFKIMHERLAAEGLQFSCEPYRGPWEIAEVAPYIDRIMTEFWHRPGKRTRVVAGGERFCTYPSPGGARHNIVEAEAFTSAERWTATPGSLKQGGDHVWLQGVNRFVLHSCVLQPWGEEVKPGVTMGRWGTHFGRNQTWAQSGKAWFDYIARSQALLQWGRPATGRLNVGFSEIARTDGKTRIHFLVNESGEEKPLVLPEGGRWYDPVTGGIGAPPATLAPHQSGFYELAVGRADAPRRATPEHIAGKRQTITNFSPSLGDWAKSEDPEVRYFSGTRTYRAAFDAAALESVSLDLGEIHCATATVRLNGRDLGTLWCAPWRVEIPDGVLKPEGNILEIDVVNTWRNRLIGDELEPPDVEFARAPYPGGDMILSYPAWFENGMASRPSKGRRCFATWNYFTENEKDAALMPSGLVGPVTVVGNVEMRQCENVAGNIPTPATFSAAAWIGAKGRFFHYNTRKEMRTAAVYAKDFTLRSKPDSAMLKISVAGYWDIRVNGREITEDVLMPTPSNFDRRVYMKDYDIAPFLVKGANRIEVTLGNSIYNCPTEGAWMQDTITWRDDPQLICEIVADGKVVAATDATWRVHLDGPVRENSIRCGETYDARKEALSPDGWENAVKKHGPGGIIVRERHPPTRIWKRLAAKKIGDDLWDAGQNLAGFVEITVRGQTGAVVTIRTREELGKDGKIAPGSSFVSGGEFQCDRYILKGGGEETWHPRFSYGGFRYIEATVSDGAAEILGVTACAVGSDLKEKPFPAPENPALASLLERAKWSIRSNMVGFPTDCPSREKQGWTGDALAAAEGAIALYDGAAEVYADWLRTLADVQRPNGQIPCKSPISANGYNWGYGPTWDAAIILIPEIIFDATGDDGIAREMYEPARRYAAFMDGMLTDDLAIRFGLGDWTSPVRSIPTELLTSAYAREVHRALARFALRFGKAADAAHHEKRAAAILAAIRKRFCRADGSFTRNEPASLAVAAALKLVPDTEKAAADLNALMIKSGGVMNCGMFGSKYIPRALAEYGYIDTAVLCFTQEASPGWQWQKNEKGATTLWEYWNGRASHNHVIHGGDFPAWWKKYGKNILDN